MLWRGSTFAAAIVVCRLHAAALELRTHAFDEHARGKSAEEVKTWNEDLHDVVDATKDTVGGVGRLMRLHANILGQAVSEGMKGSAAKLRDGDLNGALEAASGAMAQAQIKSQEANASFQSSVPRLLSMLLLVVGIGFLWGLEHVLSLWADQDASATGSSSQGSASESPKGKASEFYQFQALGSLRFILSCMVLLYNFYPWTTEEVKSRKGTVLSCFSSWGVLAAPMFFTLSGFCQSFAKTVGSKAQLDEDFVTSFVVRVMAWYPYYVITLTFLATYFFSYSAWDWSIFTAQFFLVNGALEDSQVIFPYLPCSWWFSCLAVYTLGWYPMHTVLKGSLNSVIWTMFTVATAVVVPSVLLEFLFMSDTALFQMIQYSPSYCFGQALAIWQVKHCMLMQVQKDSPQGQTLTLQPVGEMPFSARFGVTTSCLILGLVMIFISPFDELPLIRKPCASIFTKGLLLPVFGLLIVGLCNEADPLARLAARPVVSLAGKLSLSMFLLALPMHVMVRVSFGFDGFTWTFLACLLAASVVGHFLIELPSRKFANYLALVMNQKVQK